MRVYYKIIKSSPVGALALVANDRDLLCLNWITDITELKKTLPKKTELLDGKKHPILVETESQLKKYFKGKLKKFTLPLSPHGTTFQKKAWRELLKIPYGTTISYGEQAARIGKPKAARAVGAANGKNPIGIIIPCHRVIGANGTLTGFANGIDIKLKLIEIES